MNFQINNNTGITAIILAADLDFGRCEIARRLPFALWPVIDKPVICRLLDNLSKMSIDKVVICCNENKNILQQAVAAKNSMKLYFLEELMPCGTAGCIRDAAKFTDDDNFIIVSAQTINPPDLTDIISRHKNRGAVLTILFDKNQSSSARIFIANREIIKYIPQKGYFDIKENLIPVLVRQNKKAMAEHLPSPLFTFRNRAQYLNAISCLLMDKNFSPDSTYTSWQNSPDVLVSCDAKIDLGAKIFGPAVIGKNVSIDKNSIIEQSVLWDNTAIGENCFITQCVADYNSIIPSNSIIENKAVVYRLNDSVKNDIISAIPNILGTFKSALQPAVEKMPSMLPSAKIIAAGILFMVFAWSYLPQIRNLLTAWSGSDEYSAGFLVPFLAAYIIRSKNKDITQVELHPCFAGFIPLIFAQIIRLFGLYYMYASAERLSIVLSIWSIIIIIFGWKLFYNNLAIFLFLLLMLPLPRSIHTSVMLPLQNAATASAVFCLETIGYAAGHQGNILYIDDNAIAVSEACNGLRMMMAFLIIIIFMSLLIKKNRYAKFLLLLSVLPIAFACNIARLTLTAIIFTIVAGEKWAILTHDFSGYAMMPLAIAMAILELWLINIIAAQPRKDKPKIIMSKLNNQFKYEFGSSGK